METAIFENRIHAGRELAKAVSQQLGDRVSHPVLVLALPRGGVPVAREVARELAGVLDVLLVRKLGVPGQRELALGAIATGGVRVLDQDIIEALLISADAVEEVTERELELLRQREQAYGRRRDALDLAGKIVVLVDDGVATGSTMRAAIAALRRGNPHRVVVAVPVGAPEAIETLAQEADETCCVMAPPGLSSIGRWYRDFSQVSDEEVREILEAEGRGQPRSD